MIPYGRQDIVQADVDAVVAVLRSDFLTQGPVTPAFEEAIAEYCGVPFALAVNSATSALHLACLALGLGPGDWLWTSPITFVASANCGLYCGAQVDFVDIDPRTYNLCPKALERKLNAAQAEGRLPKVLIPVHMCGQSCDMQAIYALSQKFGIRVVEDASHAIGAKYQDLPVGDCRYCDITVFSFHPVKIITTAEGGVACTRHAGLHNRMALLRSHGITRNPEQMTHEPDGAWYYQQVALGFNYRMTELQAALGISQMKRLDAYVQRRHELALRYRQLLATMPVTLPWHSTESYSAFHLYVIRLQLENIEMTRRQVFDSLRKQGVGVNIHYIPVHTQPYYRKMGFEPEDFPVAQQYYAEAISLPIFSSMDEDDQLTIAKALSKAITA